jgi:hypothetical protein
MRSKTILSLSRLHLSQYVNLLLKNDTPRVRLYGRKIVSWCSLAFLHVEERWGVADKQDEEESLKNVCDLIVLWEYLLVLYEYLTSPQHSQ